MVPSFVKRYYKFLHEYSRDIIIPDEAHNPQVWIPDQNDSDKGQWISSKVGIGYTDYDMELLPLFPRAFGVTEVPD